MYYTETKKDSVVRGSISFIQVLDSFELETTNCFEVRDTDEQWLLCAEDFLYIE